MDEEGMSTARYVGVWIALGVAVFLAYSGAATLSVVLLPRCPLWFCWLLSGSVTLALMWFVITGVGNVFFEGIVCWSINGLLIAFMVSMPIRARELHLEQVRQKHLHQLQEQQYQQWVNREKAERKRLWDLRKAHQK